MKKEQKTGSKEISRRDFLKGTAAGAASLAAMGLLGACSNDGAPSATSAAETAATTAAASTAAETTAAAGFM